MNKKKSCISNVKHVFQLHKKEEKGFVCTSGLESKCSDKSFYIYFILESLKSKHDFTKKLLEMDLRKLISP
jgi:hypothetical protein